MYNKSVCVIFVHINMITLDIPTASTKFSNKMWLDISIDSKVTGNITYMCERLAIKHLIIHVLLKPWNVLCNSSKNCWVFFAAL